MKSQVLNAVKVFRNLGTNDAAQNVIDNWNKDNPDDPIIQPDAFGPKSEKAITRWKKFVTQKVDLTPLKKITNYWQPVLLVGETGTGKEILANALHGDREGAFIAQNCGSVNDNLILSTLFGHTKGSFTGAVGDQDGLIAKARKGTLFLDEIGRSSHYFQGTLLRMLSTRKFRPVGGNDVGFDARVVLATTNVDNIIPDLYARVMAHKFEIPPLRTRLEDVGEILDTIDPEGVFPRSFEWNENYLKFNVRSVIAGVERYIFYGELPKWEPETTKLKCEDFPNYIML